MQHNLASPFLDDQHYSDLRGRLIGFFAARGCHFTADLADDTLMRLFESRGNRPADCPVDKWAFGIARNVLREAHRASWRTVPLDPASPPSALRQTPQHDRRLEFELLPLSPTERALLHEYFFEGHGAKILAGKSGITAEGVRGRAHRVLQRLRRRLGVCPTCSSRGGRRTA